MKRTWDFIELWFHYSSSLKKGRPSLADQRDICRSLSCSCQSSKYFQSSSPFLSSILAGRRTLIPVLRHCLPERHWDLHVSTKGCSFTDITSSAIFCHVCLCLLVRCSRLFVSSSLKRITLLLYMRPSGHLKKSRYSPIQFVIHWVPLIAPHQQTNKKPNCNCKKRLRL